jgi:hypothetical protein
LVQETTIVVKTQIMLTSWSGELSQYGTSIYFDY